MLGLYVCLFTPRQKKQTGQKNKLKQILNRLKWSYLYRFSILEHCSQSHMTVPWPHLVNTVTVTQSVEQFHVEWSQVLHDVIFNQMDMQSSTNKNLTTVVIFLQDQPSLFGPSTQMLTRIPNSSTAASSNWSRWCRSLICYINSSRTTVVAADTAFATISSTPQRWLRLPRPPVAGVLSVVFRVILHIAANSLYLVQKVDTYFVYSYSIICTIFNNLRRILFTLRPTAPS